MDTVIGIDLGTSSVKTLLMDIKGQVLASHEVGYRLYSPSPGWAEQDPNEWWLATQKALRNLSNNVRELGANVLSIGLSGQMNGAVLLNESFDSIRPCIIWADARTVKQCDQINAWIDRDKLTAITGKLAVTGYTAPKILWVRQNEPENFNAIRHILLPKDFIRLRLTGEISTDLSDASNTILFNINEQKWSPEILQLIDLDEKYLPPVVSSLKITGKLTSDASKCNRLVCWHTSNCRSR